MRETAPSSGEMPGTFQVRSGAPDASAERTEPQLDEAARAELRPVILTKT